MKELKQLIGKRIPSITGHWIKIMAYSDNYYMLRRKGSIPFVLLEKETKEFIEYNAVDSDKIFKNEDEKVNELGLKFGTFKYGNFHDPQLNKLLNEAYQFDEKSKEHKDIICKLIDACDKVYIWYDNKYVSKEEAKGYVLNYKHK